MNIEKICEHCNNNYQIPHWRESKTKFCSRKCSDDSKKAPADTICTNCGEHFHMKKHQKERYPRTRGFYCSKECMAEDLKEKMKGELNHQFSLKGSLNSSFKGKEITRKNHKLLEIRVYSPEHPYKDRNSRVLKHRLVVEENYHLFDIRYFEEINGKFYLKKSTDVHHKDENHSNNDISNLQPLTRSEHTSLHNKLREIKRDKLGRITGVIKRGELLENLETDNQQPSLDSNIFEGSTTNSRVQTDNAEDGNTDTSALHP